MTERVNPSKARPATAFKTAGAIAYAGGLKNGYVVPSTEPTPMAKQDGGVSQSAFNDFTQTHSTTSFSVDIDPGEAIISGVWLAIDTSTSVTLSSSTANQTVYVGWDKSNSENVIIGKAGAFASDTGNTDQKIPLFDFDTDGNGVTGVTDRRVIGDPVDVDLSGDVSLNSSLNVGDGVTLNGNLTIDGDGSKALWGENQDFSVFYENSSDELVIKDETNGVELIRQPKSGSTKFLQGADIGSIEAPEDSFTQLANTAVTSALASGSRVGYSFAVDSINGYEIDAAADGSGGLQDLDHRWYNHAGTERMRLTDLGDLKIEGSLTEGAAL